MWTIVPSSYDFIGMVALSVSMSASTSPSLIWSPTLTSHWAITPVSMVGLSFGIVTSIGTSILPAEAGSEKGATGGGSFVPRPIASEDVMASLPDAEHRIPGRLRHRRLERPG